METKTKTCPYCGEEIMATAKKCKHCGEWLEEKDVPMQQPVAAPMVENKVIETVQTETEVEEELPGFFDYYFEKACGGEGDLAGNIFNFNFSGTIPRRQFWVASIILGFYGLVFTLLLTAVSRWICVIIAIALCLKSIELQIRRLHDIGKSGWLILLSLIPVANIYLLVLYFTKGSDSLQTQWKTKDTFMLIIMIAVLAIALAVADSFASDYSGYY